MPHTTYGRTHLTCAETARALRKELAQVFPGVKFSVRSDTYSGGASIRVNWTDGPTSDEVESITNGYEAAGFDGSIDLKYYKSSWLMPDGTIRFAKSEGTTRSMGTHEPDAARKPHPDAVLVSTGADYVLANRHYTASFLRPIAERVCRYYGEPMVTIRDDGYDGDTYIERTSKPVCGGWQTIDMLIMQEATKTSGNK